MSFRMPQREPQLHELPAGDERTVSQLARAIFTHAISSVLIYEAKALPERRFLRLADEAFRAADSFAVAALRRYRKREREARSAQLKYERELRKQRIQRRKQRRARKKGSR